MNRAVGVRQKLTGYLPDDKGAEGGVGKEKEGRKPSCVLWVAG